MDEVEVVDGGMDRLPVDGSVERCRRMVVYDGVGLRDAAVELGVTQKTVERWARDGGWLMEKKLLESRQEEKVREALTAFAMSREMPIANMYYELQRLCATKLREIVEGEKVTPGVLDAVLSVAEKGMDLAERVMRRAAPGRELDRVQVGAMVKGGVVNVGGGEGGGGGGGKNLLQVNILQAACKAGDGKVTEVRDE